ncbi:MAG: succinylglutamate desuccinylase/aspartoacylase family protein [Candidatus Dormibacteraeota bacterium]|nr:succinylglutamate desuccinylase/aspartoacylase family protein [Candidatus Dormibacteraeota bacterium]
MSIRRRRLDIPELPGGLEIPYVEVAGAQSGPRLTLLGGVHGCEYAGMKAVRRFVELVDQAELSGSITAVPVVNIPAFRERTAFVVPHDRKNLNRCFPGDPAGTYTDVLAHRVFDTFVRGADYLVDLHAGDLPESLQPMAIYDESPVGDRAREMAFAYATGHVVRLSPQESNIAGSSSAAAAAAGVPAIIAEVGGNGVLDGASVEGHLRGLRNVCRQLGMLPGAPEIPEGQTEHHGWVWMYTPVGGWWEPQMQLGSAVKEGSLLGTVSDLYGDVLYEVRAPEAGVPLFVTSSPAVAGGGLLLAIARPAR